MCLIVYKDGKDQHFSNKSFKSMISRNDDGLGIMYRENGRVVVHKTVGNKEEMFKLYRQHRDKDSWAMHARFKTHGVIDEANCHPYKIMDIDDGDPIDLYLMHNGVLSVSPKLDEKFSDTWHYVEYILKPMFKANVDLIWNNEFLHNMIKEHIGKQNKFLLMRSDDVEYPVLILNSSSGIERNGMWLSNNNCVTNFNQQLHGNANAWRNRHNYGYIDSYNNAQKAATPPARKDDSFTNQITTALQNNSKLTEKEDDEFAALLAAERAQEDADENIDTAQKLLTDQSNSGIILPLKSAGLIGMNDDIPKQNKGTIIMSNGTKMSANAPKIEHHFEQLSILRGSSDHTIRQYIKDDPENIADIIISLYDKNTMKFASIVEQCAKTPDNIVRLLRNMTVSYKTKKPA